MLCDLVYACTSHVQQPGQQCMIHLCRCMRCNRGYVAALWCLQEELVHQVRHTADVLSIMHSSCAAACSTLVQLHAV
jgi:hypothetical protein